jgi:sugar lactone lactonase YvrE
MQSCIRFGLLVLFLLSFTAAIHAQALTVNTIAGNGVLGFAGDGGLATSASFSNPGGVALDGAGNVYIADTLNNRIRKVSPTGVITTVAGGGTPLGTGFSGDSGLATLAELNGPTDVASDAAGNLFIADTLNNRIRRVFGGSITTMAGNGGAEFAGSGSALNLSIGSPTSVAVDRVGNVYFAVQSQHRILRVTPTDLVTVITGTGTAGFSGDFGPATQAAINSPGRLIVDSSDNLYFADSGNYRVRKITPGGLITTVAGNGSPGVPGVTTGGGQALSTPIGIPVGVAIDAIGNLYISSNTTVIRKVTPSGIISTIAGTGTPGFSGDGGFAILATFGTTMSLAADASGNIIVSDLNNQRVRKLQNSGLVRVGGFAQIASGGGWKTTMTLVNLSGSSVDARVSLYGNDGTPLTLPLTLPNSSVVASSASVTLAPNNSVVIETESSSSSIAVGWANVEASAPLNGYAIFRSRTPGVPDSEGTALLDNGSSSLSLLYDNTLGFQTGVAFVNPGSALSGVLTVTLLNQNGFQLASSQIIVPALGHLSFFLRDMFLQTNNTRGIMKLENTTGAGIVALGLRFNSSGSFTSVPVIR